MMPHSMKRMVQLGWIADAGDGYDLIDLNVDVMNGFLDREIVEWMYAEKLIKTTLPAGGVQPMLVRVTATGRRYLSEEAS